MVPKYKLFDFEGMYMWSRLKNGSYLVDPKAENEFLLRFCSKKSIKSVFKVAFQILFVVFPFVSKK